MTNQDRSSRPRVSLLVPVFNRELLVAECIKSALNQTFGDFEVVIVDGASTDNTFDVCRQLASTDVRVRVYREETNSGPVHGWWECVQRAQGEFATFLWSDDLLAPDFLESTVPLLSDPSVAFALTAAEIGEAPGKGCVNYLHKSGRIASGAYIEQMLSGSEEFPVSPACSLFRLDDIKDSFTPALPTEPRIDLGWTGAGTDMLLYVLTASRYPAIAVVGKPLAFFRAHPGSITTEGRGGLIVQHYALARAWAAHQLGRTKIADKILTEWWIKSMKRERRPLTPSTAAASSGGLISPTTLLRELPFTGLRLVARRVRRAALG